MASPNVFVAGSRGISRLPVEVKRRIDLMIDKDFQILVGDAAGADKAVQGYLAGRAYQNVVVHCNGEEVPEQRRPLARATGRCSSGGAGIRLLLDEGPRDG